MTVVAALRYSPVKSMGLVEVDSLELHMDGAVDDRRFFLLGDDDRVVGSNRAPRQCLIQARYAGGVLALTFPDGREVAGEPVDRDTVSVGWEADLTLEAIVVDGPWAEPLGDFVGERVRVARIPEGRGGYSVFGVSLIGRPSIDALGLGPLDPRRFRMLIETDGGTPFEEDAWVGREVRIGEALVRVVETCPRCAVTTRDPASGERDVDALRAMIDAKGVADLGIYGEVVEPGAIRVGDAVEVTTS
jgi:uncharacterized protein YcbX